MRGPKSTNFRFLALVLGLTVAAGVDPAGADRHVPGNGAAKAPDIVFQLPIECEPGTDCWIGAYPDDDAGPGFKDYTGGTRSYDGHKGTDIMIRDLGVMARGVAVLAAAPGVVAGIRDGVADVAFRGGEPNNVGTRQCGNGVGVNHAGGWFTQYCHLRRGSLVVKVGDRVKAGQPLGLVGLSGQTNYPHVHFQVQFRGKIVDPFAGLKSPSRAATPLWTNAVIAKLPYRPALLFNAGFSSVTPGAKNVRRGLLRDSVLSRLSPVLFLWVDMFNILPGDSLTFNLFDPTGKKFLGRTLTIEKRLARRFQWVGAKKKATAWPTGGYRGEIILERKIAGGVQKMKIESRVDLR